VSQTAFLDNLWDMAGQPERLDEAIHAALAELGRLVPDNLAAFFVWRQEAFHHRVLSGPLATDVLAAGGGRGLEPRALPWLISEAARPLTSSG
jgi:hypothetical protein